MKFILEKDKLDIENKIIYNSGSVLYYEADVEYDESWNDLTIEAVIIKKDEEEGVSRSIINNKIYLDKEMSGSYSIGFVGYTIENNEKSYQISTNLKPIIIRKGAGEIETNNEDIPTPTEWEIYIAQIQEMLEGHLGVPEGGTTGQILAKKSNADGDVEWTEDVHLSNAYLDGSILILELNNGNSFRVNLGGITPPTGDIQLVTKNNEIFVTSDNKNFIVMEEN